jgi:hypothetical protein
MSKGPLLHAVNFPKSDFNMKTARTYYLSHFKPMIDHTSEMKNFYRITTVYTKEYLKKHKYINYITKKLTNGIDLILAYK